jgi:hypothetical protein
MILGVVKKSFSFGIAREISGFVVNGMKRYRVRAGFPSIG